MTDQQTETPTDPFVQAHLEAAATEEGAGVQDALNRYLQSRVVHLNIEVKRRDAELAQLQERITQLMGEERAEPDPETAPGPDEPPRDDQ